MLGEIQDEIEVKGMVLSWRSSTFIFSASFLTNDCA